MALGDIRIYGFGGFTIVMVGLGGFVLSWFFIHLFSVEFYEVMSKLRKWWFWVGMG